MSDGKSDKLISRLAKIKAMTTSPNKEEAETAMLMLQKMLEQHGVTEAQLTDAERRAEWGDMQETRLDGILMNTDPWAGIIRSWVCSLYNCQCATIDGIPRVFGREANIEAVKWVLTSIYTDILDSMEGFFYRKDGIAYAEAYALGLGFKLHAIVEQRAPAKVGPDDLTALSVQDEAKHFMLDRYNLKRAPYKTNADLQGRGFSDGMNARTSIDLKGAQLKIGAN